MLTRLELKLKPNEKNTYNANIGSILQGFLMENIGGDFIKKIHNSNLHPYSQYIISDNKGLSWIINTLDEESKNEIIDKLKNLKTIELKHRKETIEVEDVDIRTQSYEELIEKYYMVDQPVTVSLKFLTPTSFKHKGKYMICPTLRHIFQSLIMKFNCFSKDTGILQEEFLQMIEELIILQNYQLKSTFFSLEGVKIPSFYGEVMYRINGPGQMINMIHMLSAFGEYSGVGIKAAIGMGAIRTKHKN